MRAPFPLALRIGTDIIATRRILSPLKPDINRLVRLTERFLHSQELNDLSRRFPDWKATGAPDDLKRRQLAEWVAGRWAAKEAAKKAWDASLLSFRDLRVETEPGGGVHIVCDTHSTPDHSSSRKVTEQIAQLTISHDGDYTIASVLATPLHPDILADLGFRKAEAEAKIPQISTAIPTRN